MCEYTGVGQSRYTVVSTQITGHILVFLFIIVIDRTVNLLLLATMYIHRDVYICIYVYAHICVHVNVCVCVHISYVVQPGATLGASHAPPHCGSRSWSAVGVECCRSRLQRRKLKAGEVKEFARGHCSPSKLAPFDSEA